MATGKRWDSARERLFLGKLAETTNVAASLRACGMSTSGLYKRRLAKPAFARAWDQALNEGYAKLEARLLNAAVNGMMVTEIVNGKRKRVRNYASERVQLALLSAYAKRIATWRAEGPGEPDAALVARDSMRRKFDKFMAQQRNASGAEQ